MFSCEISGRVVNSAGYAVKNEFDVASVDVNWIEIASAPAAIPAQLPLLPTAVIVIVSPAPSGVEREPTTAPVRVSTNRHGATAVITLPRPLPALTRPNPPAVAETAATAATTTHLFTPNLITVPTWRWQSRRWCR